MNTIPSVQTNETFKSLLAEFENLEKDLQNPSILADHNKLKDASTRHAQLLPQIELIRELRRLEKEEKDIQQLKETEDNTDMLNFYKEEADNIKTQIESTTEALKILLVKKDPDDNRNAIIEIRAGTGGEEAALFAGDLFRMYSKYAEKQSCNVSIISASYSENGGFKEIIAKISGHGVYGNLKHESGVHRVQRIPVTESSGRIHTSAASVVILPEVDDMPEIHIEEKDIKVDVYRSTGPGGQSVNTTDSAVRITHIPTGIVVTCQDSKSQHKNKDRAMSVLKSKLYKLEQDKINTQTDSERKNAIKTGDRSAKIRTYNFPQGRITDHRIKKSWFNIAEAMNGEIDGIISDIATGLSNMNDI